MMIHVLVTKLNVEKQDFHRTQILILKTFMLSILDMILFSYR